MVNRKLFNIIALYCFFLVAGRVYSNGETVITLGNAASWQAIERRFGVIEVPLVRPNPVLALAGYAGDNSYIDLYLSFNEGQPGRFSDLQGRYDVFAAPELRAAPAPWSRTGAAAALFTGTGRVGEGPLVVRPRLAPRVWPQTLFAAGNHVRDFSLEFWVFPQTVENGAQILSWVSYKPLAGDYVYQRIQCIVLRNRTQWTFDNFFSSPDGVSHRSLTLSGPVLVPQTWSHHLIRFDADIGLLEYWVNGRLESVAHSTVSGREGGEVYTPIIGENGHWTLGAHFSGMMDVFRVHSRLADIPALERLPAAGGRIESRTLDLGRANSRLLRIEASGGRTSGRSGRITNEYVGNSVLNFADHSAVNFFVRVSNEQFLWNDSPWIPVTPGMELPNSLRGRFVQIAADFYPSADGQTSPYLSELRVVFHAALPPPPPTQLIAVPRDGAVELSWRASPSRDMVGYMVYFGSRSGEYFGENVIIDGVLRSSPINVGSRTSIRIEGLTNGKLYFFAVAAFSGPANPPDGMRIDPGEFSREVAARPLRTAE